MALDGGGNAVAPSDPFGFNAQSGYYADREIGTYYCQARNYAPGQGRWLEPDPIGWEGGMNLYSYCGGLPVGRADPNGTLVTELMVFGRVAGAKLIFGLAATFAQLGWMAGSDINEHFGLSQELADEWGGWNGAQNAANRDPNLSVLKHLWFVASESRRRQLEDQYPFLAQYGAARRHWSPWQATKRVGDYTSDRYGHFYQSGKLFFTKDLDNHGGAIWKFYAMKNGEMVHQFDTDGYGKKIEKHKGETGKNIPVSQLKPWRP